jgi:hypothetical protein
MSRHAFIPSPSGSNAFPRRVRRGPRPSYTTPNAMSVVASGKVRANPALHKNRFAVASGSSPSQGIEVYCIKVTVTRQSHSRPFVTEFRHRSGDVLSDHWTCPYCGHQPALLEGFVSFAPALAQENSGLGRPKIRFRNPTEIIGLLRDVGFPQAPYVNAQLYCSST